MKRSVQLPIVSPIYSTYHSQGSASAIFKDNPSVSNWYYNEVMMLRCNTKFLSGYTSPEINIEKSTFGSNPNIERIWTPTDFVGGYIHAVIHNMLDKGYYVVFYGVDDFYIKGKSWYKELHAYHDGLICGYDRNDDTYTIFAYDSNWIYRVFKVSKKDFDKGVRSAIRNGKQIGLNALKPKLEEITLDVNKVCENIGEYLDSTLEKFQPDEHETVYGTVVHDYIGMYLDRLFDGTIPYGRIDKRVFRMIWEHKKVMYERMVAVEKELGIDNELSVRYKSVVKQADNMRMLYASHTLKQRNSVLPVIKEKLMSVKESEKQILTEFVEKVKERIK